MNSAVTVIGASVAGLFAAYRLARQGVPTKVYEAQPSLNPSSRTLIVTPAWLRLLDFDPSEAILNRTHTFELVSPDASVRIPLREPDVVLERARFLRILAHRAQQAGAELVLNHSLEEAENHNSPLSLHFRNGHKDKQVRASTVLGADGVRSTVSRAFGIQGLDRVALLQARVPLPPDLPSDTVRVWFDRGSTRFFVWLIPESTHTGALGLIADTPQQARDALERFLTIHDMQPIELQAAWVPMHPLRFGSNGHQGHGKVLLIGDAAGQVKVSTVGGVVTGMSGGSAAVRALTGRASYASELRSLRQELNFHAVVRRVLDSFTDEDYAQLLRLLNHRALEVLSEYNRDELAYAIWRLLPAQPRWMLLGARALLRGFVSSPTHHRGSKSHDS